jgi:Ca-activated chloride channel family protein
MNTRRLFTLIIFFCVLLAGCAPAATQAPIAVAPQNTQPNVVQPTRAPAATRVPEATKAPEGRPQQPAATYAPMPTRAAYPTAAPTAAPASGPGLWPKPVPPDNQFKDYGTNPYTDTRVDHLSTFAVDVDTASYTVTRKYLNDGMLPPQDAVRPEEFINFFDAGYNPPAQAAFSLYAEGATSPFYSDGNYILRFGVQGYRVPESQRKPVALTFVIDISGSMNMDNRLGLVKRALTVLVDRLRPQDTVGVVVFGTSARVALAPTAIERKDQILNAINGLRTEGSTNAEAGLRLGYQQAMQNYRPTYTNKVLLCSDGVANTGLTNAEAILEYVQGFIKEGITLNTYGFGMGNFNDTLLEKLADRGDGMYAYIDTMDEAYRLFIDSLTSTLVTIALDAKTQIDFNPEVVRYYRLIGYENRAVADQDFRNDTVDAGEIGAGHHVVALYSVYLQPNANGRVATAQLRWLDPKTRQATEINGNLNTWDLKQNFNQMTPHYKLAVLVAQYAETLKGTSWAQETDLSQVARLAAEVSRELPYDQDVSEFVNLVNRAASMLRGGRRN